jgi:7,8-dihydropterin-6-yl-methyl-4-(beta-D-ribofuranosyl)aminobenzene 5'-phosphate synthase
MWIGWPGANFQLVDKNIEIAPDIHLIALVSDKPGTLELRELSLASNTRDGMVIVVGCSHPGIDKQTPKRRHCCISLCS